MNETNAHHPITRSKFLKIAAGIVGGSVGAYVLYEVAPWMDGRALSDVARMPLRPEMTASPPMRELVRYATLAASGHNAQPWLFTIGDHQIQIQPNVARRLPAVDPNDRELWISLGCALENLAIAARMAGFEPEIGYPDNQDVIQVNLVSRKPEEVPIYSAIPLRQNTRSEYDGSKMGAAQLNQVVSIPLEEGIHLRVFDRDADTEKVLEYVTRGNLSQFNNKAFVDELIHWIRFDKREAIGSLDGLSSLCMGSPQVPRWIGQQVVSHMTPRKQTDSDAKMLRSSSGAIAISSDADTKSAWVRTGQVYQRLALHMTSMNIKTAFLNQPNEVPEVRTQFQSALGFGGALPQLLLRFGIANRMPNSFRRSVDDVIIWL